jgi:hypothetical protein
MENEESVEKLAVVDIPPANIVPKLPIRARNEAKNQRSEAKLNF